MAQNNESYIDQLYELARQKQQVQNKTAELNYQKSTQDADKQLQNERRNAYVSFKAAANPYGSTHEALSMRGLGASGAEEKTLYNQFNAYQSALADAYSRREKLQREAASELISALRAGEKNLYDAAAERVRMKLDDYWKQYEWAYRKSREEKLANWE